MGSGHFAAALKFAVESTTETAAIGLGVGECGGRCTVSLAAVRRALGKCFKLISPHSEIARYYLFSLWGPAQIVNQNTKDKLQQLRHLGLPVGTASLSPAHSLPSIGLSAFNLFMIKCLFRRQYQNTLGSSVQAAQQVPLRRPVAPVSPTLRLFCGCNKLSMQSNARPRPPPAGCHSTRHSKVSHCHMKDKFADKNFGPAARWL